METSLKVDSSSIAVDFPRGLALLRKPSILANPPNKISNLYKHKTTR